MKHDPLLQSLIQGTLKLENVAVQHNTPAGYTTLDQTQKATKETIHCLGDYIFIDL